MPKKRKGERWKRINQKILSELEYLSDFEQAVETSFAAAEVIATNVARAVAPDKQAEVKASVERALLRAAPSEASAIARQAAADVLGAEAVIPEITIGLEGNSLIGGTIQNRAEMYTDATYATYENNVLAREMDEGVILGRRVTESDGDVCDGCESAATDEFIPLADIEDIGSQECGPRCRCEIEFGDEDSSFRTSDVFSGVVSGQDRYGGDVELN